MPQEEGGLFASKPTLLNLSKSAKMDVHSTLIDIVRANIDRQRSRKVAAYFKDSVDKERSKGGQKGVSVVETNPPPGQIPPPPRGSQPAAQNGRRRISASTKETTLE